ncbi:uncharacterized protein LOC120354696 [Nilaparvata lugens]|uniref:uncharacterized protein LOC120354696 n=1 Tax=Nilaparvata lugens TaxID=108931 RepID=UPI00193D2051|nr:uncharacterized protein LOC120354696 [Nilaparvata lugens]
MSEDERKKWRCFHVCKNSKSAKGSTSSGNLTTSDNLDEQDIRTLLQLLNTKLTNIETTVNSVQSSQEFLSAKYDELLVEIKELRTENKKLTSEIAKMNAQLREKDNHINDLSMKINDLEQYGRINNLEIHCLEVTDKSPLDDLKHIADKINVKFNESDVSAAHRLPIRKSTKNSTVNSPPVLIVQFVSKIVRAEWLTNGRAAKLTNKDLGNSSDRSIYFNENLTAFNKRLFMQAKLRAKPLGYKYVWTSQGRILVRKEPQAQVIRIKVESDLDRII